MKLQFLSEPLQVVNAVTEAMKRVMAAAVFHGEDKQEGLARVWKGENGSDEHNVLNIYRRCWSRGGLASCLNGIPWRSDIFSCTLSLEKLI